MGKHTYRAASQSGYFPFPDTLNVVVTREDINNSWGEDRVLITNKKPSEILHELEKAGFESAFLAGGGQLNTAFMREKLIDEIYFDIEPLLLGKGIKVFADSDFEAELELIATKQLNKNTVQLHYKVCY